MKYFLYTFLIMMSVQKSCSQHTDDKMTINYTAQTRGFNYEISIVEHTLTYTNSSESIVKQQRPLSTDEVAQITSLIRDIDLPQIKDLVRPSTGAYTDRSAIASLQISPSKSEMYNSSQFDHGNPPTQLKALITYLQSLL
jgi:hypothetical protein